MKIYSGPVNYSPGSTVNGFSIEGVISEDSTFRVFKAESGTKFVTLKTVVSNDAMSLEILRREYELCRTLSHPCIVNVLGFEEESPVGPAIVMEFIEGQSLDEFAAHCASRERLNSVLKDILDGVDYLHHRGILHNDLKPDNIIVNSNGAARIIDFGLSLSDDSIYKGLIGGSTGYSAPEILNGTGNAGAASDIYSIGLLIRLLFGNGKYSSIYRKCCRLRPSERFQSIESLRAAISRHDKLPVFGFSAAVVLAIVLLAFFPKMEYSRQQRAIARMRVEITAEMDRFTAPVYDSVITAKSYFEAQDIIYNWYSQFLSYLDSMKKAHPSLPGEPMPAEVTISAEFARIIYAKLDSLKNSYHQYTNVL